MVSDAEQTSRTGTDTRSSWFPKRCRFWRKPTKSVTTRLYMCVHVCDKCLCVSAADNWIVTQPETRLIRHRMCVQSAGNASLNETSIRAPVLGRQTEFTEAAISSVNPITRSETDLDVSVEESGPVLMISVLCDLINSVRQVLMRK